MTGYVVWVYRLAQATALEDVPDVPALLARFPTAIEQDKLLKSLGSERFNRSTQTHDVAPRARASPIDMLTLDRALWQ